ncbi:MAG: 3-oxoacyl-[acyl-carrier-protein] reductase [Planctomycetia bacterium]
MEGTGMGRLAGKTALVTGASRGIGRAIAARFAQEGAKVGVVYNRSREPAEKLAEEIRAAGGDVLLFQHDVAEPEGASAILEKLTEAWGRLDVLVNSAGIIKDGLMIQLSAEDWQSVVRTNLDGTFFFCKAAAIEMMRKRSGSIINISSVAAQHSNKGQANYAASKAGIEAMTRTLAAELGKRKVRVNAIAPGFIETDMTQTVRNMAGDKITAAIPMARFGQPEDIAAAAVFLASEDSTYITGQVLTVDGGLSLGAHA